MGGFSVLELRADVWRVTFGGNGYTTTETAQTYWLNRSADLTLEKGYNAFEILSDMQFVRRYRSDEDDPTIPRNRALPVSRVSILASPEELAEAAAWRGDGLASQWHDADAPRVRLARGAPVFIYSGGSGGRKPALEGDIRLKAADCASAAKDIRRQGSEGCIDAAHERREVRRWQRLPACS